MALRAAPAPMMLLEAVSFGGRTVRGFLSDPTSDAEQQIFGTLPPDIQASFRASANAAQSAYASIQPAVNLAQTIGSGGVPSEAAAVAGVAAIASAINPIGGAALAAMGAAIIGFDQALQQAFQALGFYGQQVPSWQYVGFQRKVVDSLPSGPGDVENWISVRTLQEYGAIHGDKWGPNPIDGSGMPGGRPPLSGQWDFQTDNLLRTALYQQLSPEDRWRFDNGSWVGGTFQPSGGDPNAGGVNGPVSNYFVNDGFQLYYLTLLVQDLQFWANGLPYVDPRELLKHAVMVWNATHSGDCNGISCGPSQQSVCYAFRNDLDVSTPIVANVLSAKWSQSNQDAPNLCVNVGPARMTVSPGALTVSTGGGAPKIPASTGKKVLVGTGVVAVGAGGAVAVYAAQHGISFVEALRRLWHKVNHFQPRRHKED